MPKIAKGCPKCENRGTPREVSEDTLRFYQGVKVCGNLLDTCEVCNYDLFFGYDVYEVLDTGELKKISPEDNRGHR